MFNWRVSVWYVRLFLNILYNVKIVKVISAKIAFLISKNQSKILIKDVSNVLILSHLKLLKFYLTFWVLWKQYVQIKFMGAIWF